MNLLLPTAVFMLMVSVGMSLSVSRIMVNWRRLTLQAWTRLLLATFILPPAMALALSWSLHLGPGDTAGLFLIGVAPGAPLMTRGAAKKGFDMQMAASYQFWGALMIPIMIPLMVFAVGRLYDRDIWIPPLQLIEIIARQQFLPLIGGMALMYFLPAFSQKAQQLLNMLGNAILTAVILVLLWKMGMKLHETSPVVILSAFALAAGCLGVGLAFLSHGVPGAQTLAFSNCNRHVGLALLLSGQYVQSKTSLPAIASYAVAAIIVMTAYARWARPRATPQPH
ncbi:MAG: hypothetical protein K1X53_15860 [Candidatus Sumerlaeaceae bacterium]|nr:hypothetical protein [Candidatus Sumerlaeaceae bacterium]